MAKKLRLMTTAERVRHIAEYAGLDKEEESFLGNFGSLGEDKALKENPLGVHDNLTYGIAQGIVVNDKEYMVPMAIEEASVIASQSNVSKIIKNAGGYKAEISDPCYMFSQIQLVNIKDTIKAEFYINDAKEELLKLANEQDPMLIKLGGGARDLKFRRIDSRVGRMVVAHLYVDVLDAMGANAVNTMAEAIAPRLEEITGGESRLRIISNLADNRLVVSKVDIPFEYLETKMQIGDETKILSGEDFATRIEQASAFAEADPYRAATSNKGVMNGVDAFAIAFAQDWRALEAGAHTYAQVSKKYGHSLTQWTKEDGYLHGEITIPMPVGTVGGSSSVSPLAKISRKIAKIENANELSMLGASVGLGQNFAAVKALATEGINRGHMTLHARNIAAQAGATGEDIETIANQMVKDKTIRQDYAEKLLEKI